MSYEQMDVMDCLQALKVLNRIKEDPVGRFDDVQEFKSRRGWAALCYKSWEACRIGELLPKDTGKKNATPQPKTESVEQTADIMKTPSKPTMDYWFALGRYLADKNGGKVPHNMELRRLKKYQLYRKMMKFPEEFAEHGLVLDRKDGRPGNLKVRVRNDDEQTSKTTARQQQA